MVRHKNRYLLVSLEWEDGRGMRGCGTRELVSLIRDTIRAQFGDFGLAHVIKSLQVKVCFDEVSLAIVRVDRESLRMLWGALSLVTEIGKRRVTLHVVNVSGSARCGRSAAQKHLDSLAETMEDTAAREAIDWAALKATAGALVH